MYGSFIPITFVCTHKQSLSSTRLDVATSAINMLCLNRRPRLAHVYGCCASALHASLTCSSDLSCRKHFPMPQPMWFYFPKLLFLSFNPFNFLTKKKKIHSIRTVQELDGINVFLSTSLISGILGDGEIILCPNIIP